MEYKKLHKVSIFYNYFNKLPDWIRVPLKINKKKRKNVLKNIKEDSFEGDVEKTAIILGVPRSGTSMTGNILHRLGIYLSDPNPERGMEGNVQGFFESGYFADMDDKILAYANGFWNKIPPEKLILEQKKNKKLNQEIADLIRSQEKKVWGWKGIRTSLTIPLYHPYLRNPYYIFVFRNPLSSVKSIEKATKRHGNKMDFYQCFNLYLEYSRRLLNFAKSINSPKLFISYEKLLNDPKKEADKIKKFLGIKKEIDLSFISKKYKHF